MKTKCVLKTLAIRFSLPFVLTLSSVPAASALSLGDLLSPVLRPVLQPNLAQIGVTKEVHGNVTGEGVGIAVFDTRIYDTHPNLVGRTLEYLPYAGDYDAYPNHGTHVAGIAAASPGGLFGITGVAPGATVHGFSVFDDNGWVAKDVGALALKQVRALNKGGANIAAVNMSYGPTVDGDLLLNGEANLFAAYRNDFVIVRAAGNQGTNLLSETTGGSASRSLSHLLIVGSVGSGNAISSFSNRPGDACLTVTRRGCAAADKMANFFIVAPGENILSTYPGSLVAPLSGTSMAAPHVTGAVALIKQDAMNRKVKLTPTQIASIIKESATDLGAKGVDAVYGWGLLNVEAALAPVGGTAIVTTPTVPTAPKKAAPAKQPKKANKWQAGRAAGLRGFSQSMTGMSDLLSGLVMFDKYGRPYEADTTALVNDATPSLSERGLAVLGLVSQRKVADIDTGEHAFLAWNATGMDGKETTALRMAAEDYDLSIGLGAPELFLMEVPSANRAATPQSFSRIMFSSLGEAAELFGEAVSVGFNTALTERLTGHVFGLTGTDWLEAGNEPALLDAAPEVAGDADFVSAGLSYRMADGWSFGGSYAVLRERGTVAGMASSGALSLGEEALTQFWGANVTGEIDDRFSVSAFYTRATIDSTGTANSLFDGANGWSADHYGVMFDAKNVVHENSVLRFSLVKPLQITSGTASVRVPVGRELDGTVNYVRRETGFDGSAMPLEAGFSYLAETGAGTFGLTLDIVDTNLNGAGERGVSVGAGFAFEF